MPASPELKQQIDDLAFRVVMANPDSGTDGPDWNAALRRIHERAVTERAMAIADAAGAAEGGAVPPQDAIARLQQAMECDAATGEAPAPLAQDPELLRDFVLESRENLLAVENQILRLEREPSDSEALHAVFRGFHTIKGLAGFLELWEVQKLSHEVEAVLERARNGQLNLTAAAFDVVLAGADRLRQWVDHVEALLQNKTAPGPPSDDELLGRIRALASAEQGPAEPDSLAALAQAVESPPAEIAGPAEGAKAARAGQPPAGRAAMAVKVDTGKLDYLVDMAGEMVIAQSLVRHDPELAALRSAGLQRKIAQLTRISGELQKTAMAMRLVPVGPLFQRMGRLVRDLSRQCGKTVEMETQGDDIELDRTIVEELADPLMHMVRNAVDHGIEAPAEREKSGKRATAHVLLKAQHQAGQVVVEVTDDGRGLDAERIRGKAIEKGFISAEDALTESEIYNLVFLPGFSTAEQVTKVSGRGVGMDVVRRHIERLRGRIEVRSIPGQGATFLLKLPLTLAIIDGLVVGVGEERYIAPLFSVRELLRPGPDTIWTVEGRAEMALIRGALFPVVRLYRRFGVKPRTEDPLESVLVVAEVESQRFCLLVDELIGKQEVVIKSLGELFRGITGIAGGAILGDGRVGLILDVERLYKDRNGGAKQ